MNFPPKATPPPVPAQAAGGVLSHPPVACSLAGRRAQTAFCMYNHPVRALGLRAYRNACLFQKIKEIKYAKPKEIRFR